MQVYVPCSECLWDVDLAAWYDSFVNPLVHTCHYRSSVRAKITTVFHFSDNFFCQAFTSAIFILVHVSKSAFTPADSDWILTETGLGSDFGLRSHQTGLALDFPRICDVRGQLYFNFCFTGAHCCPRVQWTTTSPWQPVHFQSEVSPIAFTFAWVRSEFFPQPTSIRWTKILSKLSPNPVRLRSHYRTSYPNPVQVRWCERTFRNTLFGQVVLTYLAVIVILFVLEISVLSSANTETRWQRKIGIHSIINYITDWAKQCFCWIIRLIINSFSNYEAIQSRYFQLFKKIY